jgi:hypothetical protein
MSHTKKAAGIALFALLLSPLASADIWVTADTPHTVKLLATRGDHPGFIPIGEVRIWEASGYLYIKYVITNADWRLKSTHVYVTSRNRNFTPVGGYVEPFRLELEQAHMGEMEYTYEIPNQWPADTQFRVAAQAEVLAIQGYTSDLEGLIESLPRSVQVFAVQPSPDDLAYFQLTIMESVVFDGFHHGWCVDLDRNSYRQRWYTYEVYTPFDKLPPKIMEFPENLDLANWVLNQDFVGKTAQNGELFTFGDVQHCIWKLLEGRATNYTNGPWSIWRVEEILDAAEEKGEGFIPACGEKLMLILVPMNPNRKIHWQSIGMAIPTPCIPIYTIETAWGLAWNVSWYSIGPGLSFTIK